MGLYTRLTLAIGILVTMTLFQNCGSLKSGLNAIDSGSEGGSYIVDNGKFLKGDPYNPALIPFDIQGEASLNHVNTYLDRTGYKALAFNEEGSLYIASSGSDSNVADQDDWNEAVLERCQLFYMNKPCSLFAAGDVIAQNRDDFIVGFNSVITVPSTFDGTLVPGEINHWQDLYAETYSDFTNNPFKAFALGLHGATHVGWSQDNQAEANRRALEFCESISDEPCTLYAIGMDVIFDLDDYEWEAKRLEWGTRVFDVDQIPFVPESVRETIRTEYAQANFYALALDRYGFWESVSSASPITQQDLDTALADCNAQLPVPAPGEFGRSCFIYSIDGTAVLTRDEFTQASYGY